MSRKRHRVDQIIGKLRQADVELGQGETVEEACRALEITVQTYYRWRQHSVHCQEQSLGEWLRGVIQR
jgi:transposase-like protein